MLTPRLGGDELVLNKLKFLWNIFIERIGRVNKYPSLSYFYLQFHLKEINIWRLSCISYSELILEKNVPFFDTITFVLIMLCCFSVVSGIGRNKKKSIEEEVKTDWRGMMAVYKMAVLVQHPGIALVVIWPLSCILLSSLPFLIYYYPYTLFLYSLQTYNKMFM